MYRLPFQGDDITSTTASTPHTLGSIDEGVELALEEAAVAFLSATASFGRTTVFAWMHFGLP